MLLGLLEPVSVKALHDISAFDIPQEFWLYSSQFFPPVKVVQLQLYIINTSQACSFLLWFFQRKGVLLY